MYDQKMLNMSSGVLVVIVVLYHDMLDGVLLCG
jgi:hypothetical protein